MMLSHADDRRAAPVFGQGIQSQNGQNRTLVGIWSAELEDLADIPLLVQASYGSSGVDDRSFARALATYARPGGKAAVLRAVKGTKLYGAYVWERAVVKAVPARK